MGQYIHRALERRSQYIDMLVAKLPDMQDRLNQHEQQLDYISHRLAQALRHPIADAAQSLKQIDINASYQRFCDHKQHAFEVIKFEPNLVQYTIQQAEQQLIACGRMLEGVSYQNTLARGYAVVRRGEDVISSHEKAVEDMSIEFHDGTISVKSISATTF